MKLKNYIKQSLRGGKHGISRAWLTKNILVTLLCGGIMFILIIIAMLALFKQTDVPVPIFFLIGVGLNALAQFSMVYAISKRIKPTF